MKAADLLDMIGETEDRIIEEAKKNREALLPRWTKFAAIAACLCLIIFAAISIIQRKQDNTIAGESTMTGDPIQTADSENSETTNGAGHTANAGEDHYTTLDHMAEIRLSVDIINSWGFIGTIEIGVITDKYSFDEGEQISVIYSDNVTVIQKDGSIFEYNDLEPNADKSDLSVGDSVWVGFQTFDCAKGNGMYNQIYAYHVGGAKGLIGRKPFSDLTVGDITSATVQLLPPNKTIQVTDITELTEALNEVVIYDMDNSYTEYNGQAVIFTITLNNGKELVVNAFNPFIIIDGVGYKTDYEPCEKLSEIANSIAE